MVRTRTEDRLDIFVSVIIGIVFLGLLLGFNSDKVINWIIPLGISFILTGVAGDLLESATGNFFKRINLEIELGEKTIKISWFIIMSLLIKWLLL